MMILDARVTEDGTLVAKIPQSFIGKEVQIHLKAGKSRQSKPLSNWEAISSILNEVDALDIPQRNLNEILANVREFRETQ